MLAKDRALAGRLLIAAIAGVALLIATGLADTDVSFRWSPNQEPDLAGYRIYRSAVSGQYVLFSEDADTPNLVAEIPCGPNDETCAQGTDTGVPSGAVFFWVATAFDTEGFESLPSEEASKFVEGATVGAPLNLKIKE